MRCKQFGAGSRRATRTSHFVGQPEPRQQLRGWVRVTYGVGVGYALLVGDVGSDGHADRAAAASGRHMAVPVQQSMQKVTTWQGALTCNVEALERFCETEQSEARPLRHKCTWGCLRTKGGAKSCTRCWQ